MENTYISPSILRADYARSLETLANEKGVDLRSYRVKQHQLILGVPLSKLNPNVMFSPNAKDLKPNTGSNGIEVQEMFAIDGIGLRFGKAEFSATTGISNVGNYFRFTFPDPAYFAEENKDLLTIVNGNLSLEVGGSIVFANHPAQDLTNNPVSTFQATPLAYPAFGGSELEGRGVLHAVPQYILDGEAINKFTLTLAEGDKALIEGETNTVAGAAGTTRNIVYLVLTGWLITPGAENKNCSVK